MSDPDDFADLIGEIGPKPVTDTPTAGNAVSQVSNTGNAGPARRPSRGRKAPTAAEIVAIRDQLPRNRMAPSNGPSASDIEATAQADRKKAEEKRKETEAIYTRLLGIVAENPTHEAVAAAMGWPLTALQAFLTENKAFAQRYEAVRKRHTAESSALPAQGSVFVWDDEKRQRLIEKYIDRGDLLEAQEYVGATPSQFNRELRENGEFAQMVGAARKEALETLRMRALKEGLGGNDKLLTIFLKALEDDGGSDVSKLTDEQLNQQITRLLKRARDEAVKNGFIAVLDAARAELLTGGDITFLLQAAVTALKTTGSHASAAATVGRTVDQFEKFLAGCAEAGLVKEVQAYRDTQMQLERQEVAAASASQ